MLKPLPVVSIGTIGTHKQIPRTFDNIDNEASSCHSWQQLPNFLMTITTAGLLCTHSRGHLRQAPPNTPMGQQRSSMFYCSFQNETKKH